MDEPTAKKRISAVVPAYNEGQRLAEVLEVLMAYPDFIEVIVVDDGSEDATVQVAKKYPVVYLKNERNSGKAQAMDRGVQIARGEIIFFCDADVVGLTPQMIDEIVVPVSAGRVAMFIAMRDRGTYLIHRFIEIVPLLGGERALTKELWLQIPEFYKQKFRIEAALNFYAKYFSHGFSFKIFPKLKQTIKEKKYGFWKGLQGRLAMIWDVAVAILSLQFTALPRQIHIIRLLLGSMFVSTLLIVAGLLALLAVYVWPLKLIFTFFSNALQKDPNAPFVYFLINIFQTFGRRLVVTFLLAVVAFNALGLILQLRSFIANLRTVKLGWNGLFRKSKDID